MLTIGDRFPAYQATAVVSTDIDTCFQDISNETTKGEWQIYFFYPKDFTFICPTEIAEFDRLADQFAAKNARVYGVSTDNEYVHLAWRRNEPALKQIKIPLISDLTRELSTALGVLDRNEGVCTRATFIVDPEGIIRHASANDLDVGRRPEEFLRILEALQSGELCGCNWQPGEQYLKAS